MEQILLLLLVVFVTEVKVASSEDDAEENVGDNSVVLDSSGPGARFGRRDRPSSRGDTIQASPCPGRCDDYRRLPDVHGR